MADRHNVECTIIETFILYCNRGNVNPLDPPQARAIIARNTINVTCLEAKCEFPSSVRS